MDQGIFPNELKIGKVTPIFKKGDKQKFENDRPISILPIFGKIFEKVIYVRLYSFLSSNNILSDCQFGFRKGHSTSHALNHTIGNIFTALGNKKHVIGIFIDLSKAFDTIDHTILMKKLFNFGIRGTAYDLLLSYISHRMQTLQFHDEHADLLPLDYGVPQGSVLGPLLFLLYINDIVNSSHHCNFVLYADYTNLFVEGQSIKEVYDKANHVLKCINNYMVSNLLHINMSKCNYIYFRPNITNYNSCARARQIHPKLFIGSTPIKRVHSTKFLGVIIDEDLNWIPHIDYLLRKLKSCIGAIRRIKNYIPKSQYSNVYHSLFESHLVYCISVWGGASTIQIEKLFMVQKRCIRMLFGARPEFNTEICRRVLTFDEHMNPDYSKEHVKPILNTHEILAVRNLYTYHSIVELSYFRNGI